MADLKVSIAGVELKNPLIAASGVFGFGREYDKLYDISVLGGISIKGTTLSKRAGNPPPRVAETPSGMLNSVGLQNPGVEHFIENELPFLQTKDLAILANIAGSTAEECGVLAKRLDKVDVDFIELNISCPNVKEGGAAFGASCLSAAEVTKTVRQNTTKPLIVKLSPNVTDIAEIAKAVESEGADAVSLINTVLAMRINVHTRRPVLYNNMGGLSGPAIFPIAVRMVYQTAKAVGIPVIGMGGIASGEDVAEMMLAGASAVQIGSVIISDPFAPVRILEELHSFLDQNGVKHVGELTGAVKPW